MKTQLKKISENSLIYGHLWKANNLIYNKIIIAQYNSVPNDDLELLIMLSFIFNKHNDVKILKAFTFKHVTFISCQSFMIFNLEILKRNKILTYLRKMSPMLLLSSQLTIRSSRSSWKKTQIKTFKIILDNILNIF